MIIKGLWKVIAFSLALLFADIHRPLAVQAQQDDQQQQDEEETDPGGDTDDGTNNANDQQQEEGEDKGDGEGEGEGDEGTDNEGGDEDEATADDDTAGGDDQEEDNETEWEEDQQNDQKEGEEEEEGNTEDEEGAEGEEGEEDGGQQQDEEAEEGEEEEGEEEEGEEEKGQKRRKTEGNVSKLELLRCQNKNGNFLPIATVCQDKQSKEFCERVFPSRDTNSHGRPRNCDLPGLKDVAYGCAHHCKVCCELKEHGCGDDPRYQINCAAQKDLCKNMTAMMTTACASTCGLCATGACVDTQDGCIGLRHMCDQKEFEQDMQKCARTCGFCTPKCADLTKDCLIADENSCNPPPPDHLEVNPYYEEMAKVCRQRCHLCDKAMPLNKRIAKKVADRANHLHDGMSDEEEEEERRAQRLKRRR